jgi:hypothetical protein
MKKCVRSGGEKTCTNRVADNKTAGAKWLFFKIY